MAHISDRWNSSKEKWNLSALAGGTVLRDKWQEALSSVVPICSLVLMLCFLVVPLPSDALSGFTMGAVLIVVGMGLFNLGADMSMTPIGESVGAELTRSRKLWILLVGGFAVGFFVTLAEPDLTVLATQVSSVPNLVMLLTVALGVGIFLMLALLRIVFRIRMNVLLLGSYLLVSLLALFVPPEFMAVAFDSGGVTTGPMTVPFILSLGVGVASLRADKGAENDSFGLVAFSSIGPILSVMLLSILYRSGDSSAAEILLPRAETSRHLFHAFWDAIPYYLKEMGLSLLPVIGFFLFFQFAVLHLRGNRLRRILVGLVYTYIGLTLFMTGVNVGFLPVGHFLGESLGGHAHRWVLIPIGMVMGWFVVSAEPAVAVLTEQVYAMTAGAVPKKTLRLTLSAGIAVSIGMAMARVLYRVPIQYMLVPGYLTAFLLMIFSPSVFTAIAFDSGGVASGPMTATFLLPMAMGACKAVGGDASDAFGLVALVAMTPLLAIQILGIVYRLRTRRADTRVTLPPEEIIELM